MKGTKTDKVGLLLILISIVILVIVGAMFLTSSYLYLIPIMAITFGLLMGYFHLRRFKQKVSTT